MTTAPIRPPLVRRSDRFIAGVCSGLAAHLGWPVRNVRVGMTLATLAGGAGIVFYAWLWIMVPTADEYARRTARRPASPIAPAVSTHGASAGLPPSSIQGRNADAVLPPPEAAGTAPGMQPGPAAQTAD